MNELTRPRVPGGWVATQPPTPPKSSKRWEKDDNPSQDPQPPQRTLYASSLVWRNPKTVTHRSQPYRTASQSIFDEKNADGKLPSDMIDLHGQYVGDAAKLLRQQLRVARSANRDHLRVIVGKGLHSRDNIPRIKPRVEQVCRELGYEFYTERNEGCIFIDLRQEVPATLPPGGAMDAPMTAAKIPVFGNIPPPPGLDAAPKTEAGSSAPDDAGSSRS